jgi:hypothetical protein
VTRRQIKALLCFARLVGRHPSPGISPKTPPLYWEGFDLLPYPQYMPAALRDWRPIVESMAFEGTVRGRKIRP